MVTKPLQRIAKLIEQAQQLADKESLQAELQLMIGRVEDFAMKMKDGLAQADWTSQREIIRALL